MEKKKYQQPQMEVIQMQSLQMLAVSGELDAEATQRAHSIIFLDIASEDD